MHDFNFLQNFSQQANFPSLLCVNNNKKNIINLYILKFWFKNDMKLECILRSMYDLLNFVAKVPANQRKQFFLDCYVKIRKK